MPERHYRELDGLRGLACLAVVLDHCVVSVIPSGTIPGLYRLSDWLLGGVDLFFVLSGFLIGGILLDNKGAGNYFRVFWTRRVGRIMPVYYLLMLSFFVVLAIKPWLGAPWLDDFLFKNVMPLWTYPLFVQNFAQAIDGGSGGARWVASTWSLAIEEQFYLLLPPLIYLLSRRSITALAVGCIVVALVVRTCAWQASGSWFTGYFLLPGRMDALMFGVLGAVTLRDADAMGRLQRHRRAFDALALVAVLVLSTNVLAYVGAHLVPVLSLAVQSLDFTFKAALFFYMIMRIFLVATGSVYRRMLSSWLLVALGAISYPLYMYHPAINGLLHGMAFAHEPEITDVRHALVALAVIAVSVVLAWVSTRYFEMPIRRLAHRARYRDARPGIAPASGIAAPTR